MKICLIAPHYPPMPFPCGAAHFVSLLAQGLADKGHDITILHGNSNAQNAHSKIKLHLIKNFGFFSLLNLLWNGFFKQFDLVDIQFELFMYQKKCSVLLLPIFCQKVKWVLTLHSQYLPTLFSPLWRYLQMNLFSKVIFYSLPFLERMKKNLPNRANHFELQGFPSNITFFENTRTHELIKSFRNKNDVPTGVFFGHITRGRNIEEILAALFEIKKNQKQKISFVFLGQFKPEEDSYHREILLAVKEKQLEQEIQFSGRLSDSEVSLLLQSCDYALLPFTEGASLKNGSLSACLVHGLPCITTQTEITDAPLLATAALMTYSPGDSMALYNHLIQVISDNQLRKKLAQAAREFSAIYSWQNYLNRRVEIYQQS